MLSWWWALSERGQEIDYYSVQAFRYVAGRFFINLGAKPESFSDLKFRGYLPAVYSVIQNTQHLINWDTYLRKFAEIKRTWWTKGERKIHKLPYDDPYETDLDHLITGACLVAHVYDPNKRWLTDENRILRTRAILMFLLHETDEFIAGDKTPDEADYEEAKENALFPAKILLKEVYWARDILLQIWDEFNAKKTDLAKDIDFLDHEAAVHKWSLYDWEFSSSQSPHLAWEFGRYYSKKHRDHPDVHILQQYYILQIMRTFPWRCDSQPVWWIKMLREMWWETEKFWDMLEQHDPWLITKLSNRILDQFSCILPE